MSRTTQATAGYLSHCLGYYGWTGHAVYIRNQDGSLSRVGWVDERKPVPGDGEPYLVIEPMGSEAYCECGNPANSDAPNLCRECFDRMQEQMDEQTRAFDEAMQEEAENQRRDIEEHQNRIAEELESRERAAAAAADPDEYDPFAELT